MLIESSDGLNWKVTEDSFVASYSVNWDDGARMNFERLEMPKLYFEDGMPRMLLRGAYLPFTGDAAAPGISGNLMLKLLPAPAGAGQP